MISIKTWRHTECGQHCQRGNASFEAVLVLPVIFFFLVLIFQSIKASWLWLDRVIAARNSAWQTELYFDSDTSNSDLLLTAQALGNPTQRYKALTSGNIESVRDNNTLAFSVSALEDFRSRNAANSANSILVAERWLEEVRKIPNDLGDNSTSVLAAKNLTASVEAQRPDGIMGIAYSPQQQLGFGKPLDARAQRELAMALLDVARGADLKPVVARFAGEFVRREQHVSDFSQGWSIDPVARSTEGYDAPLKQQLGGGSEFKEHIE